MVFVYILKKSKCLESSDYIILQLYKPIQEYLAFSDLQTNKNAKSLMIRGKNTYTYTIISSLKIHTHIFMRMYYMSQLGIIYMEHIY